MKASMKAKRAPKRNLFAELSEGMTALADARQGKRTSRRHFEYLQGVTGRRFEFGETRGVTAPLDAAVGIAGQ